nr:hypothetical protein [Candidatus Sigynarchaeota archaeon]
MQTFTYMASPCSVCGRLIATAAQWQCIRCGRLSCINHTKKSVMYGGVWVDKIRAAMPQA